MYTMRTGPQFAPGHVSAFFCVVKRIIDPLNLTFCAALLLGHMGELDEVADVCLFLASPLARWMSGANVKVHGGGEKPAYLGASTGDVTST